MSETIGDLQDSLDGGISFGHPQDPDSDTSTTLAGAGGASAGHNGTLENINGAWVEVAVDTTPGPGVAITFTHNLNLDVPVSGSPNVRWLLFGASHDGTGTPGSANITVYFEEGDTVAADSIQLTVGATGLTVDDTHPLTLTLFFIPAVRFSGA
jgi:hypothetical protein